MRSGRVGLGLPTNSWPPGEALGRQGMQKPALHDAGNDVIESCDILGISQFSMVKNSDSHILLSASGSRRLEAWAMKSIWVG